ncbi:FAD binding domain-containing protein [Eremomyces bilateralis CBS 781.70]|uniref:FAD binding domain-containing protein n=1 Tax=Eremomyces bilateralis CBS 781.70 TaxID=1392243 RepID=A0A6G1G884_9PEZI|nr:FAD binding domain-containing protein [Eremomyces bilateralis CBS 781.70]KAF1814244.1 FAD binding domain-containing protein [Eremomyces bilateralis CBS 781.70]
MKLNNLIWAAIAAALSVQSTPTPEFNTIEARLDEAARIGIRLNLTQACTRLQQQFSTRLYLPGSAVYDYETTTRYWTAVDYSTPACVFVPKEPSEISLFVQVVRLLNVKFAIRGGGHMPIPLYNNADSNGILLSTSNLTTLSISSDKNTLSVGPGRRWREVADYLASYGKAAVGGRVGKVGVPGLILGGGISFYSSQYGWGSDSVVKFQCVLASGQLIEATATNNYSDLFWALKAGGNSFCLVTRFDIKVYNSPSVWVGIAQYDASNREEYLNAVYTFGAFGSQDPKSAIVPTIIMAPAAGLTLYAATKFYDSPTLSPTVFQNFTAPVLTPLIDTITYQPLNDYLAQTDPLQPDALRQKFRTLTFVVNKDAVTYIHDTFTTRINELAAIPGVGASMTFQPITKNMLQAGANSGGNPIGLDANNGPYFAVVLNWNWLNAADDAAVSTFASGITAQLEAGLQSRGVSVGFRYLNDADKDQLVFQNYGAANLAKLKSVRSKYDSARVFTDLMPGGWKVAAA